MSSIFMTVLTEVVEAYWLFSQKKMTGRLQTAARFIASWTGPRFEAPSPKKQTAIWSVPRRRAAMVAPTARLAPPPTTPLAPSIPTEKSAMCMLPPLPLREPVTLAYSSATLMGVLSRAHVGLTLPSDTDDA